MPTRAKLLTRYAANYDGMFAAFFKALNENPEYAKGGPKGQQAVNGESWVQAEIAWAKKVFKGNNAWITWWLRWVRLSAEKMYTPELFEKDFAALSAKAAPDAPHASDVPSGGMAASQWHRVFEHYMGTPAPQLAAYRPGFKSILTVDSEMGKIEKEWQESRKGVLQPQAGDKAIIDFGDGWAWWLLDRHKCDEESRAMGHCGNGGSYDTSERILSLRQKKGGNDWEPHLTFILDSEGNLGEMKGKNNDKPVQRYHKYVTALLLNDIVKGMKGGGYMPEHNFAMQDLTEEEQNEVYEKKPALMPISAYYKRHGSDETFVQKVLLWLGDGNVSNTTTTWSPELKEFVIQKYGNTKDLVEEHGNDTAQWCVKILDGDEELNTDSGRSREEDAESMLDDLENDQVEKIGLILKHEYEGELEEWQEQESEDFDPTRTNDIVRFAEYAGDDELLDALSRGYETGYRYGTETEIHNALEAAIKEAPYKQLPSDDGQTYFWDSPWLETMTPEKMVELIDNNETPDDFASDNEDLEIKVSSPYYGFSDYDKKGAVESFGEEYDVDQKFAESFGEEGIAQFEQQKALKNQYMEERSRLADEIRKKFADVSPEVRQELKDADHEFRQGDYAPFVKMVRAVIPDAFAFAPVEEPEMAATA